MAKMYQKKDEGAILEQNMIIQLECIAEGDEWAREREWNMKHLNHHLVPWSCALN